MADTTADQVIAAQAAALANANRLALLKIESDNELAESNTLSAINANDINAKAEAASKIGDSLGNFKF